MARKLSTKNGHHVYSRRKTIVEPVFGQMTTTQNARQLLLRGKQAARAQWRFNCAIHNLLKLHRNGGMDSIKPNPDADPRHHSPKRSASSRFRDHASAIARQLDRHLHPQPPIGVPALVTDPRS